MAGGRYQNAISFELSEFDITRFDCSQHFTSDNIRNFHAYCNFRMVNYVKMLCKKMECYHSL